MLRHVMIIALGYALDPSVASGDTSGERSVCVVMQLLTVITGNSHHAEHKNYIHVQCIAIP